jgi:hypothetical protein
LAVGQGTGNHLELLWNYNATPASATAAFQTYGYLNPLTIDASVLTIQAASGGPVRFGHNTTALGTRTDTRDLTLTNNTAVYTETQRSVASVSNDTIVTVNGVTGTTTDAGATRAVIRNLGTANGYAASTKGAFVRAIEGHTLVDSSIPNDVTRTSWIMELGLHSQLAGDGATKNSGIYIASSHTGWLPTGVRNDTALLITGEDGWTSAIRYYDTNGTSLLFQVDQTGTMSNVAINTNNAVINNLFELRGTTTPAMLTANVNDYATGANTVLRLSSSATWNITGIANTDTGLTHKLINVGSFPIVLTNEDPLSLAANRFHFVRNLTLLPGDSVDVWYDTTLARWTSAINARAGTVTTDNAQPGDIGEYVKAEVASGAAIALTTATPANVTSISLTPGDWDVYFEPNFAFPAATSYTALIASISTIGATIDSSSGENYASMASAPNVPGASTNISVRVGPRRMSLAATTAVYGVVTQTFTAGTLSAWGTLRARRVR